MTHAEPRLAQVGSQSVDKSVGTGERVRCNGTLGQMKSKGTGEIERMTFTNSHCLMTNLTVR